VALFSPEPLSIVIIPSTVPCRTFLVFLFFSSHARLFFFLFLCTVAEGMTVEQMDRMARFAHTGKFEPSSGGDGAAAAGDYGAAATATAEEEAAAAAEIGASVASAAAAAAAAAAKKKAAEPPEIVDDPAEVFLPDSVPGELRCANRWLYLPFSVSCCVTWLDVTFSIACQCTDV
jgi:hypothetical protein